jgi:phytoene desaturase
VIRRGELMSDPSLLVTNPTHTDPSAAPDGRQTYYVLAPTPNLEVAPLDWRGGLARAYADSVMSVLEERGYIGFRDGVEVERIITPADWQDQGMAAGTPFAAAHTFTQTGPFRPGNLHSSLPNVVFTGSGTQPGVGVPMVLISGKLAASRVLGGSR